MPRSKAASPSQTAADAQRVTAARPTATGTIAEAAATDAQREVLDPVTAPKSGGRTRKRAAAAAEPVDTTDDATGRGLAPEATSAPLGSPGTGGTPLTEIRNIGPATAEGLIKAGIPDAETLRALGGHEAYRRWLSAGLAPHFIGYYVLVMALQGRPWNDCGPKEKADLRRAFDALKAEVKKAPLAPDRAKEKDRLHWEAILDEIGLIAPPKRRAGAGD
jgi:DNA transformation protein and related proteins